MWQARFNPVISTNQTATAVQSSTAVLGADFSELSSRLQTVWLYSAEKGRRPATPESKVLQSCLVVVKAALGKDLVLALALDTFKHFFFLSEAIRPHQQPARKIWLSHSTYFTVTAMPKSQVLCVNSSLAGLPKWLLLRETTTDWSQQHARILAWAVLSSSDVPASH